MLLDGLLPVGFSRPLWWLWVCLALLVLGLLVLVLVMLLVHCCVIMLQPAVTDTECLLSGCHIFLSSGCALRLAASVLWRTLLSTYA
jgi:hypothetical protein